MWPLGLCGHFCRVSSWAEISSRDTRRGFSPVSCPLFFSIFWVSHNAFKSWVIFRFFKPFLFLTSRDWLGCYCCFYYFVLYIVHMQTGAFLFVPTPKHTNKKNKQRNKIYMHTFYTCTCNCFSFHYFTDYFFVLFSMILRKCQQILTS